MGLETTDLPRSGKIPDKGVELYRFHGIGCYTKYKGMVIDFDYDIAVGNEKGNRGFEHWFFTQYVESLSNENYHRCEDDKYVEELLSSMVSSGEVFPPGSLEPHGYSKRKRLLS